MTLEDKVHATRLLALRRAEELGNVSAACRELASPAACSTAGEIGTGSTVEMGFIPNATRGAEVVPTAFRSRTNERFRPWRCRTPRVGPGSTPCSWLSSSVPCLRAPFTGLCVASDWVRGMSGSFSWSVTAPGAADCSPSVRAAGCSELVGKGGTSRPASRGSSSVSTPSTSAASRASGRSGRSFTSIGASPSAAGISPPRSNWTRPCSGSSTSTLLGSR